MYVSVTDERDVDRMTIPELIRELEWDLPRDKCIALFFELQHEHGLRTTGMLEAQSSYSPRKTSKRPWIASRKGVVASRLHLKPGQRLPKPARTLPDQWFTDLLKQRSRLDSTTTKRPTMPPRTNPSCIGA